MRFSDDLFLTPYCNSRTLFAVIGFGQDFFHVGDQCQTRVGGGALVFKGQQCQFFAAVDEGFFVDALLFERHFDADVDRQFMTGAGEGFYAFGGGGARQA